MDIFEATRSYETWAGRQLPIVRADLARKHERMAESPLVFLRATFYRWMQGWPSMPAAIQRAPTVLALGDAHVENFGTWRDVEGRLIWGVNDVDEACELPYTQDLVRLATSAILATAARRFRLPARAACEAILDGYEDTYAGGGRPFVLAERRRWLRDLVLNDRREPAAFWAKFQGLRTATTGVPHAALRSLMPDPRLPFRVVTRVAGVGSLGRPRFVALAASGGALLAREAKRTLPSAAVWARNRKSSAIHGGELLRRAVRVADPYFLCSGDWVVRRLAPDCSRIELSDLPKGRDEEKLLGAMGGELANLHLGSRRSGVLTDLRKRRSRWLEDVASAAAQTVAKDWRKWVG